MMIYWKLVLKSFLHFEFLTFVSRLKRASVVFASTRFEMLGPN